MIYLLRHFEDEPNIIGGWSDIGLTILGKSQAESACDYFIRNKTQFNIDYIISSDLRRAKDSILSIAEALNVKIIYNQLWRGFNWGDLNGLTNEEVRTQNQKYSLTLLQWNETFPNGESPHTFLERVRKAWEILISQYSDKNILVCTHGINMFVLVHLLTQKKWEWQKLSFNYAPGAMLLIDCQQKIIDMQMTHQKLTGKQSYNYYLPNINFCMKTQDRYDGGNNNFTINIYYKE